MKPLPFSRRQSYTNTRWGCQRNREQAMRASPAYLSDNLGMRYLHRVHDNDNCEIWSQFLFVSARAGQRRPSTVHPIEGPDVKHDEC
jgi:hypothetical protein